jgi:hypothetical protein
MALTRRSRTRLAASRFFRRLWGFGASAWDRASAAAGKTYWSVERHRATRATQAGRLQPGNG